MKSQTLLQVRPEMLPEVEIKFEPAQVDHARGHLVNKLNVRTEEQHDLLLTTVLCQAMVSLGPKCVEETDVGAKSSIGTNHSNAIVASLAIFQWCSRKLRPNLGSM